MAGNLEIKYGSSGQTFTCTLASLATGSMRQSTVVDNSTNVFTDALVVLKVKTGASGVSTSGVVNVYAYGTVDGGTTYSDGATGTDGSFTPTAPPNLRLIGQINAVANATTYVGGPFPLSSAFGGVIPQKFGIIVDNETGAALDSTEANHAKLYQGIMAQYT